MSTRKGTPSLAMSRGVAESAGRKVLLRLVLPCFFFGLFGSLDRSNISFAALEMNASLGLSHTQYGFGAGMIFVGYVLAKYPSVLLYEAVGMRLWLSAITFTWGCAASALALITNETQLYVLRMLIGAAEGGLSSGLIIYLTSWAVTKYRASALAIPMLAVSTAQVIGPPVSGWLIAASNPLGIEGWRWMFLVEGLPAVLLGVFAFFYFPDRPAQARWLTDAERELIESNAPAAPAADRSAGRYSAFKLPTAWICAGIWFCLLASNYGIMFWLPQMISGLGELTPTEVGLIVSLPWFGSGLGLLLNSRHSDRAQERYLHVAIPATIGGVSLLGAWLAGPGLAGLAMLFIGGTCSGAVIGPFWSIPGRTLSRVALPMGIVLINVIGSFAGVTVPTLMGYVLDQTGSYFVPTVIVAAVLGAAGALALVLRRRGRRETGLTV